MRNGGPGVPPQPGMSIATTPKPAYERWWRWYSIRTLDGQIHAAGRTARLCPHHSAPHHRVRTPTRYSGNRAGLQGSADRRSHRATADARLRARLSVHGCYLPLRAATSSLSHCWPSPACACKHAPSSSPKFRSCAQAGESAQSLASPPSARRVAEQERPSFRAARCHTTQYRRRRRRHHHHHPRPSDIRPARQLANAYGRPCRGCAWRHR